MTRLDQGSFAPSKRFAGPAFEPALVVALLATVVAFGWRTAGVAIDDFYITYRYALNLAEGHGFVFNPGERVLGLTNPGLALLLSGLRVLTRTPVEILATWVFGAGLLAIVASLAAGTKSPDRRTEVLAGGLLLASASFVWKSQGSEVSLALALLLGSASLVDRHPVLAGILGGFAVWARPDTAMGLGVLFLLVAAARRSIPWRWCAGCAAVVIGGIAAAFGYFGTALPVTFQSKRLLADIVGGSGFSGRGFWQVGFEVWTQHAGLLSGTVLAVAGILGQVAMFRIWGLPGRLLACYGCLIAVAYPVLGVPFSIWYVFPVVAALCFGVSACGFELARRIRAALVLRRAGPAGLGVLALLILSIGIGDLTIRNGKWWVAFGELPRQKAYREAALWVREHSNANESIAFGEIGVIGYYSGRPIVDILGLVTPRSLPFVARRDLTGAFLAQPTDWVLFHTRRRSTLPIVSQPWFRKAYREAARFPQKDGGGAVVAFRRIPGASLPPPRARAEDCERFAPVHRHYAPVRGRYVPLPSAREPG